MIDASAKGSALEAQHTPGGAADPLQEARVHELLQSFDASLRALLAGGLTSPG